MSKVFTARRNQRLILSDRQFSIIVGSLFGDAYISLLGKIQFEHSKKAKEYVDWYMDDGHYEHLKRRCIIATDGFSDEDRKNLKHLLKKKFDLEIVIRKSGKIAMSQKETEKFLDIIAPYRIDCMAYKFLNPLTTEAEMPR